MFSKFDLQFVYHQIGIKEEEAEDRLPHSTRAVRMECDAVWLANAPRVFQSAMHEVSGDPLDKTVVVYSHDTLVFTKSAEKHERHLGEVLDRLGHYKRHAGRGERESYVESVIFLRLVLASGGLSPDRKKRKPRLARGRSSGTSAKKKGYTV